MTDVGIFGAPDMEDMPSIKLTESDLVPGKLVTAFAEQTQSSLSDATKYLLTHSAVVDIDNRSRFCVAGHMPTAPSGIYQADVVAIGKMPGRAEQESGRLFVGESGKWWRALLQEAGLIDRTFFSNVLRFSVASATKTKKMTELVGLCRYLLLHEINQCHPRLILALGKEATQWFFGSGAFKKKLGAVMDWTSPLDGATIPVAITNNPAAVVRGMNDAPLRVTTFRAADMILNNRSASEAFMADDGEYAYVRTEQDLEHELQKLLDCSSTYLAIDCEWGGRNPFEKNGKLRSITLSQVPGTALVIELRDEHKEILFQPGVQAAYDQLQRLLDARQWCLCGHNFTADWLWLEKEAGLTGLDEAVSRGFDTMVAWNILHETDRLSLDHLSMLNTTLGRYDIRIDDYVDKKSDMDGYWKVPQDVLRLYAAKDADSTIRNVLYIAEQMQKEPRVAELYQSVSMPCLAAIHEIERNGLLVDTERMYEIYDKAVKQRDELLSLLSDAVKKHADKLTIKFIAQAVKAAIEADVCVCERDENGCPDLCSLIHTILDFDAIWKQTTKEWKRLNRRKHKPVDRIKELDVQITQLRHLQTAIGPILEQKSRIVDKVMPFNAKSYIKLQIILYDSNWLGLEPVKTTKAHNSRDWHSFMEDAAGVSYSYADESQYRKAASTDLQSLRILAQTATGVAARWLDALIKLSGLEKMKSSFLSPPPTEVEDRGLVHTTGLLERLDDDNRLRTHISPTTATGRWRSYKPNMQNISKLRSEELSAQFPDIPPLRSVFVAEPGHILIESDLSQAELRVMAHLSNDVNMLEILSNPARDLHSETAVKFRHLPVYGSPEEIAAIIRKDYKLERTATKRVNFGIAYQISAFALARVLRSFGVNSLVDPDKPISVEEVQEMINTFYSTFEGVENFMRQCKDQVYKPGYIVSPFGRKRRFIITRDKAMMAYQERQACNFPIQSTVADVLNCACIRLMEARGTDYPLEAYKLVLCIHDSVLLSVPNEYVDLVTNEVLPNCMGNVQIPNYGFSIPIEIEKYGRYGVPLEH